MNILVTGAAGFIGFHLVKSLAGAGHKVTGVDCMNTYYNIDLKYGRLKELGIEKPGMETGHPVPSRLFSNVTFIKEDIVSTEGMKKIFAEGSFDIVCNLAAQAGVRYSFENPYSYVLSNVSGFINMLELSRQYHIKHFVYASSSSVYGNNANIPFEETDRTDNPQSIYAATKKADELMAHVYSSQLELPTTGLRFFTVYGPWGRPDMAPFLFLKSILEGQSIRVFNHGNLSRDFSYIDDIITGLVKVIGSHPEKSACKIYNIGNSAPVKLMDFIETIEAVTGKKAVKEFAGMQQGDVYITYANTASIEKDFGFKPGTPLRHGIEVFYQWYKKFY